MNLSSRNLNELTSNLPVVNTTNSYDDVEKKYGFVPDISMLEKVKKKFKPKFICGFACLGSIFTSLFPILSWMPNYKCSFVIPDIIGGATVAILNIPQGMAYGVLAGVKAENGLYLGIFPVFIYAVMGTSKHISIGTFSVIAIMISDAISTHKYLLMHESNSNGTTGEGLYATPLEMSTSLALGVGLIQIFMAVTQLGKLSILLSDQLVSGFCTGAIFHVVIVLIPEVLGFTIIRHVGPFKLMYAIVEIFKNIGRSNGATIIISAVAIFVLAFVKEQVNNRFKNILKLPLPIDLIVVVLGTAISYVFDFHNKYNVRIVGDIPNGLPAPVSPRMDLALHLWTDCVAIAVVVFAISLSLAKIFAKKHNYKISPNQELTALGWANIFSSFFACFPCSSALARSVVQELSGAKTQMASLVSACLMILVTLFLSDLFTSLPRCILSAVILVSSKGIFMQVTEFLDAWNVSKIDAAIWLVTMLSTAIIDVSLGLLIGVIFIIAVVIYRSASSSYTFLGKTDETNLYLDLNRFSKAKELEGIKIVHFEKSLSFLNRDAFKKFLQNNIPVVNDSDEFQAISEERLHHIIIDCSSLTYIDLPGLETLVEVKKYYAKANVTVLLANCSVKIWTFLKQQNLYDDVPTAFPTLYSAVQFCKEE